MSQVIQLADHFVRALRNHLDPEQFAEVCQKNSTPEYAGGVCASHDYCDANMVMAVAFVEVVGRDMIMDGGDSPQEQADQALWNAAWAFAKDTQLCVRQETSQNWEFSLYLQVNDPEQLLAAALAHPASADNQVGREAYLDDAGQIDTGACLKMLLDPGSLPGCKIFDSSVEDSQVFNVDFGDERN
jgi:hypothetical protein